MNFLEKLVAYDFENNQILEVVDIDITEKIVKLAISHQFIKRNYESKECILLFNTGQKDSKDEIIYEGDLLEADDYVFKVEWNKQNTCFILSPIKNKNDQNSDAFQMVLLNEKLGNGYMKRRDLIKIGNIHINKEYLD